MEQTFERRPWLLPVVLALLTLLFLRPVILPVGANQGLDGQDFQTLWYPLQQVISQSIHAGELPLWNPHEFIGHPIADNPQSALFYPATWFMWLIGVVRGLNLSIAFHVWFGAWGMAVLMRRFHARYVASLLAGVIYTMSGLAASRIYAGNYAQFVVFAWIPWMIAAYHYALTKRTWRSALPGIGATGLALLAGHPQLFLYGGAALAALWAYYISDAENVRDAVWLASRQLLLIVIGGAILGAALVIPTLELAGLSERGSTDLTFANTYALQPAQMIDLAFPGFFGNPKVPPYFYWGPDFYQEYAAYAGLLPLLAIPLVFRWRRRENWYFIGLFVLGLLLSLGLEGTLMPILWRWIPGATSIRGPSHALVFVVLGLAGLTALLITALQNSTPEERREALRPAVRAWLPIAIATLFAGAVFFSGWYASASHVEPMPLRAFIVSGSLAEASLILLAVWFVLWLWSDQDPKSLRWALLLTCTLVVLDAWHVGFTIITVSPIQDDPVWAGARINVPTGADARVVAPLGFENQADETGHLNVSAYDPLILGTYSKLQALSDVGDPTTPVNTLLGVKYLMTTKPYDKPNFKLIGITGDDIYYERQDAFPRAWVASTLTVEPNDDVVRTQIASGKQDLQSTVYIDHAIDCPAAGGTASITDYQANSVNIMTSGNGGLLTLSDQYYPGWLATVDGQAANIIRTDTVFRGVCVAAGDHTVQFEYRPMSVITGALLSGIGWALWGILMVLGLIRRQF